MEKANLTFAESQEIIAMGKEMNVKVVVDVVDGQLTVRFRKYPPITDAEKAKFLLRRIQYSEAP